MVNHMYKCAARCASPITCPPDGFLGRDCRCFCPLDSDGTAVVDCRDRTQCASHITCPPDGFLGRDCRCLCPSNSDGTAVVDCSDRTRCDINPLDTLLVTVDDERFEGTKVEHGTRVMFSCINGYEFIESTHRSISASCSKGELNQPTCRPKYCSVPAVENGRMYYEGQNYRPYGLRDCPVKKGQTIDDMISSELDSDVTVARNRRRSGPLSFPSRTSSGKFYLMQFDMKLTTEQWKRIKAANEPRSNGTLSRQKRKGFKHRDMLWKEGKVPYEIIEKDFNVSEQLLIYEAIDVWQTYTCVTFENTKNLEEGHRSRILFIRPKKGGCNSMVGQVYRNNAQDINLGPSCRTKPIIVHEIGHALGLYHEHMRPDRGEYVKINIENVLEGHKKDFNAVDKTLIDIETVPYDLLSIMHYGKLFMSKNRTANLYTIEPHDAEYLDVIGKAESASFTDIKMVNHMYKCAARCASNITCPPDGFLGKDCRCFCPSNCGGTAAVDCRDRNRCESPDVNGPYIYMYMNWEEVYANESRIDEGTMIEVLCKGDTSDETGNLTCINGTWTGYRPDCISESSVHAVEKGRMDYEGHNYRPLQEFALHGYRVAVKCSQGYELIRGQTYLNTFQTTCQLGNFTHYPLASCVEARCDINPSDTLLVAVDDERSEGPKVEHETRVSFSCRNGYEFTESTHRSISVSCSKGELNQPTCRPIVTCPPPPLLMHGERYRDTVTHERDTHGSVVENTCRYGFLLRGGSTQTCQGDGTWSGEQAVCQVVHCPYPRIDRLQLRYSRTNGGYVTASCSYGYRLVGQSRLICTMNMEWRPSLPSCTVVTCPPLPTLMYGERYQDTFTHERDTHGSVVENTCRSGFLLRGGSTQTCQGYGTWSGEPAVCQEIRCGISDVGQGIMKSHDSIRLGGINFIYCFENATYSGDDDTGLIRCTENGWTEGYCYANCILEEMDNGVILEARTIHHNEELPWRCPENYVKPLELRDVTCYNGTLTTRPSCQHVRSKPGSSCLFPMSGDQVYPYGDTCYYLLTDDYDSKQDAMSACLRKYSAKLVTVRHQNNWHFLQIVKRHAGWGSKDVWLGLRWDRDTWKWDNGETVGRFSSTLWQEGEGRNRLAVKWKRCANMEGDANWRWNDEYCSSVFRPLSVICEGSRRSDV